MTTESPQTPEASGPSREGAAPAGGARPASGPARRPYGPSGDRGRGFGPPGARRPRRKVCTFCLDKVKRIDYKDVARLRRYLSDRARIEPRRKTGSCAKHQRMLTTALKRARLMALLPYTAEHVRAMMSPQARALAGGPPPPRAERPRYSAPRPIEAPARPAETPPRAAEAPPAQPAPTPPHEPETS